MKGIESKYDIKKITQDYQSGMSLTDIMEKYGISIGHAWRILKKQGVIRDIGTGKMRGEWRKLTEVDGTRNVSLPGALIEKVGLDPQKDIFYERTIKDNLIMFDLYHEKEGRNVATEMKHGTTRLVSAPKKILSEVADPDKNLLGRWIAIGNGRVALETREKKDIEPGLPEL